MHDLETFKAPDLWNQTNNSCGHGRWAVREPGIEPMKWQLRESDIRRPKDLQEHIDRRLRYALSRFTDRIEKVIVFLHDHNGPRGGVDKVCRILVKVRGCGAVFAGVIDSDWVTAVDRATTRIGFNVARQVERLRRDRSSGVTRRWTPMVRGGA